ncbi:MAG: hypothetical protein GEV03_01530 [Streptosporangiales bacterium]|nr:hypothetical protein [Streptosporangiales bacterium]
MRRPTSTVVIVAGEQAATVVTEVDHLSNVRARAVGGLDLPDRAPAARDLVVRSPATYVVHDLDPLAEVADAWVDLFDGAAGHGRLEVATQTTVRTLRSGEAMLPDYYIVLGPETMPPTRRHWWLGVLAGAAPARVVPAPASAAAVRDALASLGTGRWWPDPPDEWLRGLDRAVPDQVGGVRS